MTENSYNASRTVEAACNTAKTAEVIYHNKNAVAAAVAEAADTAAKKE